MLKIVGFLKPIKIGQKLVEYAKIQTRQMRHFEKFSSNFSDLQSPRGGGKLPKKSYYFVLKGLLHTVD